MLDSELIEILACPKCKNRLEYDQEEQKLLCNNCRLKYRIEEEIPVLIINEAERF